MSGLACLAVELCLEPLDHVLDLGVLSPRWFATENLVLARPPDDIEFILKYRELQSCVLLLRPKCIPNFRECCLVAVARYAVAAREVVLDHLVGPAHAEPLVRVCVVRC